MFNNGNDGFTMPVTPLYGGGYGNGNGGFLGGDGIWAILLFALLFGNGGWGNGFGGGWGGIGGFAADGAMLYPWMNQAEITTDGFRDQMLNSSVQGVQNAVTSGFGDTALGIAGINQNICQTGNSVVGAVTGAQNAVTSQMYNNEIASLNRSFAEQTANSQGFNNVQTQLAQCCCDQRLGLANLSADLAREACADRAAVTDGVRDILANQTASVQRILDQMCQDKIDSKNDTIAQLRQELLYARGQASQDVQTARLEANNNFAVDQLYNRLATCPVGTMPVYGNQPIFSCNNNGCGCGCNGNF